MAEKNFPHRRLMSLTFVTNLMTVLEPEALQALQIGTDFTNGDWFELVDAARHAISALQAGYRQQ